MKRTEAGTQRTPARLLLALAATLAGAGSGCRGGGVTPVRTAFNRGVYHYSRDSYEEAVAEFREAIDVDHEDHRARFNLAVALEALAQRAGARGLEHARALRAEARQQYEEILRARPGDLRATVNLAALEGETANRAAARRRLRTAIATHPDRALPRVALAALLLREWEAHEGDGGSYGHVEKILDHLNAARAIDASDLQLNTLLGSVHARLAASKHAAGETELAEQHRNEARAAYERALTRRPDDIGTLMACGRLEVDAGNDATAATLFERALHIDSGLYSAHRYISEIETRRGNLERATYHLWIARRLDVGDPPHLAAGEYRRRLLDLYQALAEHERTRPE